jgi:hypothetical protein
MVTPDGLVRGRSDVIVETAAGAIIRDYKTGELFDRGPPRQLKPAYRDQMLLYAAVYHAIHRAWPISLELVPLTGQSVEVPHTPEIVEHALSDAVDRLSALRTALSAKLSLETIAIAGEHCGHCAYRPVCPKHPPVGGMLEDLSGGFQYARSSRPGVVALTLLSTPKPLVITGVSENRNRNPALDLLQEGDTVFAFNVRKLSDLIYVATDYTVLYKGS